MSAGGNDDEYAEEPERGSSASRRGVEPKGGAGYGWGPDRDERGRGATEWAAGGGGDASWDDRDKDREVAPGRRSSGGGGASGGGAHNGVPRPRRPRGSLGSAGAVSGDERGGEHGENMNGDMEEAFEEGEEGEEDGTREGHLLRSFSSGQGSSRGHSQSSRGDPHPAEPAMSRAFSYDSEKVGEHFLQGNLHTGRCRTGCNTGHRLTGHNTGRGPFPALT